MNSLNLLPYSLHSILIDQKSKLRLLNLLSFLINKVILIYNMFYFENQLHFFDSHVGETLCQIRAYKTLQLITEIRQKDHDLYLQYSQFVLVKKKIKNCIVAFQEAIGNKKGKFTELLDKPESVIDFLTAHDLLFELTADDFYLVLNLVLTEYSERNQYQISFRINYAQLSSHLKVGSYTVQKLIRHFQKQLSQISTDFIKDLVGNKLNQPHRAALLSFLALKDQHKRCVLPCFEVTKAILSDMLLTKHPIVLIVYRFALQRFDTHYLVFELNEQGSYEYRTEGNQLSGRPALFIRGKTVYNDDCLEPVADFIARLSAVGLSKILLANMAVHPQYSAREFEAISSNPYSLLRQSTQQTFVQKSDEEVDLALGYQSEQELLQMQSFAKEVGCVDSNPSLFLVKHIFCDIISNRFAYNTNHTFSASFTGE